MTQEWLRADPDQAREACRAFAAQTLPLYIVEVTERIWGEDEPRIAAFAEQVAALPAALVT